MEELSVEAPNLMARRAWICAMGVWLLMCLCFGVGGFVVAGGYFKLWTDQFWAAVWWELAFAASLVPVVATVVVLQRKQGKGLRDLGWRNPTNVAAITMAMCFLAAYVFGMSMGVHYVLKGSIFEFHWVRIALLPVGLMIGMCEEVVMRGFFMNELKQARVPTWLQVLLSAVCSAVFHSFTQPSSFFSSFVLFGVLSIIFVVGRRSLTAPILFHSLAHMLCDPYPLKLFLTQASG